MVIEMAEQAVYVELQGGLGNQMFQYAAGYSLACHLRCPLKLDISVFRDGGHRQFGLGAFSIDAPIASSEELSFFRSYKRRSATRFLRDQKRALFGRAIRHREYEVRNHYKEPHWHFDPQVYCQPTPVLIQGFWQCHKYSENCRESLLEQFKLSHPLSYYSRQVLENIKRSPSVSIHVRRGDYLTWPGGGGPFSACSVEYYRRAVRLMLKSLPDAVFFIFSDDIPFVRDSFEFCPNRIIVDGNQGAGQEDLVLMSACRNNIMANSSFSWWGAWLNEKDDKIVIAPRKWFSDAALHERYIFDLLPDEWITMQ